MYISKIHIIGYRNFKDQEVSFNEGINVIIGPNNAGKSGLLKAIDLVLNTDTLKKLSFYDFYRGYSLIELKQSAPRVRIEIFFTESEGEAPDSEDLVMIAPCLTRLEHPYEAQITFEYYLPKDDDTDYIKSVSNTETTENIWSTIRDEYLRKYVSRMLAGNSVNNAKLDGDTVNKIDFEFLGPIRDVERDLFSGKSPLLKEVLNFFMDYEIKSDLQKDKAKKDEEIKSKHSNFAESIQPIVDDIQKRLSKGKNHILEYAQQTGVSNFDKAEPDFIGGVTESEFLSALQLIIKYETGIEVAATHNGLGYNNLIYMSLLLAKMQANANVDYYRQNAKVFSVLTIEEPEAHLHPSLQYKFLKYLKYEQIKKGKVRQLFVTTHSTHITSAVSLDDIICLYHTFEHKIAVAYPGKLLDGFPESKQYVQRFLDVIKSDILFADRICFVEGKAEELLLPAMSNYIEGINGFEESHTTIVSTGGRYFSHFLKLFDTNVNNNAICKKVACITDRDPVRMPIPDGSFECCYPYELEKDGYTYKEHSREFEEEYKDHPNIRFFSQNEKLGKTLEYDLMWYNPTSKLLLTENLTNKEEIGDIQATPYPECLSKLRKSKESDRIKESLESCDWIDEDKKKALLASRYLNSVGKGENALELAIALNINNDKSDRERENFIVPDYIKEALKWLLSK